MAARFAKETAKHEMTVLHDDGLYRHLRFRAPESSFYWYELVTWPGFLAVGGDVDHYVFSRVEDMFTFFRGSKYGINPVYWSEKLQDGRERARRHSEDTFKQIVGDELKRRPVPNLSKEQREARAELLGRMGDGDGQWAETAREMLADAEQAGLFSDTWEWNFTDWDWSFLWCCFAVVEGIAAYDRAQHAGAAVAEPVARVTEYTVSVLPEDDINASSYAITVAYRGRDLWAVSRHRQCLGRDGEWDWESLPSERTDEWLAEHRFTEQEALRLAREAAPGIRCNGLTAVEMQQWIAQRQGGEGRG
jgi:hypothetical protein